MRTALVLLFVLAVAAIPGSLLPQRGISPEKVRQYLAANPSAGPWLDRVWAFDVFSSPWFSAIYLLLLLSVVGCLLPRLRGHLVALLREPPDAPARLDRLPAHAGSLILAADAESVAASLAKQLRARRFRTVVRDHPDHVRTVSAEKGYLKETGNLLFHASLLLVLVGVALGSWYGWHANRIVVTGADQGFCNTLQQYDEFGLGARVSPTDLAPFCLRLDDFQARYLDNGQPVKFAAAVTYTVGDSPNRSAMVKVNDPLRLPRANVYLLGHGYAPIIRYTDRYGRAQTAVAPFLPMDGTQTSTGAVSFPDANVDLAGTGGFTSKQQVGFQGVYLPTAPADPWVGRSAWPGERNPVLTLVAYRGDLGVDAGMPRSVFSLDQRQIERGRLT